jgi:DNA-binding NarL/FixJ family response regulator
MPGAARRLVIVDDNDMARSGTRMLLSGAVGIEVVGEAASGAAAVELCAQLRPDLVLMDLHLGDMDGLAATRAIRRLVPAVQVLLLSIADTAGVFDADPSAGVAGGVVKGASRSELLRAIRRTL